MKIKSRQSKLYYFSFILILLDSVALFISLLLDEDPQKQGHAASHVEWRRREKKAKNARQPEEKKESIVSEEEHTIQVVAKWDNHWSKTLLTIVIGHSWLCDCDEHYHQRHEQQTRQILCLRENGTKGDVDGEKEEKRRHSLMQSRCEVFKRQTE